MANPVSLRPEMKDYTIFIDGVSKSLAATGIRVGWAFGPRKIMDKMKARTLAELVRLTLSAKS